MAWVAHAVNSRLGIAIGRIQSQYALLFPAQRGSQNLRDLREKLLSPSGWHMRGFRIQGFSAFTHADTGNLSLYEISFFLTKSEFKLLKRSIMDLFTLCQKYHFEPFDFYDIFDGWRLLRK